jgi:hypothetical protein
MQEAVQTLVRVVQAVAAQGLHLAELVHLVEQELQVKVTPVELETVMAEQAVEAEQAQLEEMVLREALA